jgi:hypothetical protein
MLWVASAPPYDTSFPARAWAELLDLPTPAFAGARRVADAVRWLEHEGFLDARRSPGRPPEVLLKKENGSGEPYVMPAKARKDPSTGRLGWDDWYFKLPASLWTNGWMASLSGAGIALLLVLSERGADGKQAWVSPSRARVNYQVSEDTWTKGTKELHSAGLVHVGRKSVTAQEFGGWLRFRNTYRLDLSRLGTRPPGQADTAGASQSETSRAVRSRKRTVPRRLSA